MIKTNVFFDFTDFQVQNVLHVVQSLRLDAKRVAVHHVACEKH